MNLRIQKTLLKVAIDLEWSFTQIEKDCLKMIVDMVCSAGELMVVVIACYLKCQRRGLVQN